MEVFQLSEYINFLKSFKEIEVKFGIEGDRIKYQIVSSYNDTKKYPILDSLIGALEKELSKKKDPTNDSNICSGFMNTNGLCNSSPANENAKVKDNLSIMEHSEDASVKITEAQLAKIMEVVEQWEDSNLVPRLYALEERAKQSKIDIPQLSKQTESDREIASQKNDRFRSELEGIKLELDKMKRDFKVLFDKVNQGNSNVRVDEVKGDNSFNNSADKLTEKAVNRDVNSEKAVVNKVEDPKHVCESSPLSAKGDRRIDLVEAYNKGIVTKRIFKDIIKLRLTESDEKKRTEEKVNFTSIEESKKVPLLVSDGAPNYYGIKVEEGKDLIFVCPSTTSSNNMMLQSIGCEEFFAISRDGDTGRMKLAEPAVFKQAEQGYVIEKRGRLILI